MKSIVSLLLFIVTSFCQGNELQDLSRSFFQWRAETQPATGDDIPRVERPKGWAPNWSPQSIATYKRYQQAFREKLDTIPREGWTRSDYVDYLLVRSAMERVHWELNILQTPNRNPDFYVHQTLGALYELLLIHTPVDQARLMEMLLRVESFPRTLKHARTNLTQPVQAFAHIALGNLKDVELKMDQVLQALKKQAPAGLHTEMDRTFKAGSAALGEYVAWLKSQLPQMAPSFYVGAEQYGWFLKNVAMIPYDTDRLLAMGRMAWDRSVAFETFELLRNKEVPPDSLYKTAADQIAAEDRGEAAIRRFLEERHIMTVPQWTRRYLNRKTPAHVEPLAHMGVVNDLTSPTRLDEDGVSYIPEPHPNLSFFRLACARDPRPIIVHEGVPGHYFQLIRSWKNANPIRRHYFDSGANEGIGFYVEEMLLQFGLFDDRPHTREIIYRFMRLRALRVEVDIQLALGVFDIPKAGRYLARTVPMDYETAMEEAGFFSYNPGQAITYQIGKIQIHKFLSDAKTLKGEAFSLREFHDYLMENGNVPIALLRWEYLGLDDEVRGLMSDIPKGL